MVKKQFVAVTGYCGTGSSAVIDLLKEYSDVNIAAPVPECYEHVALYFQGGLYDLASILLSPYRSVSSSSMAISEFIDTAKRLNDNDFGWYGGYAEHYGATYMDAVNKFVSTISTERSGRNLEHRIG